MMVEYSAAIYSKIIKNDPNIWHLPESVHKYCVLLISNYYLLRNVFYQTVALIAVLSVKYHVWNDTKTKRSDFFSYNQLVSKILKLHDNQVRISI